MARCAVLAALLCFAPALARAQWGKSHWEARWPRFHWAELALAVGAEAAAVAIYVAEPVRDARWTAPAPLDGELRDGLRLHTTEERLSADYVSDVLFVGLLAMPFVVDAGLLAGLVHGDGDAMVQMVLIDLETYAIAHLVTWLTSRLAGRVRPSFQDCAAAGTCGDTGAGPVASFVSGHAVMAYAAAGLVCTHQVNMPWLMGGLPSAVTACGTSLAVATVIGVLRMNADAHWASDVAIGAVLGSMIGFGVPLIFHYARPRSHPTTASSTPSIAVLPGHGGEPLGLSVAGGF